MWPPGPTLHLGECALLLCAVESNSSVMWSYRWFRHKAHLGPAPNARHLAFGDSYSIVAVSEDDAGSYWCQAERRESNSSSVVLLSPPAEITVSGRDWRDQVAFFRVCASLGVTADMWWCNAAAFLALHESTNTSYSKRKSANFMLWDVFIPFHANG